MLQIRQLFPDGRELSEVCGLSETGPGLAFLSALRRELEAATKDVRDNPMIQSSGNIRDDLRYKLGYVAAIEFVLGVESGAREYRQKKGV